MNKKIKILGAIIAFTTLLVVIGILIYNYSSLINKYNEVTNDNKVLEEKTENLSKEINTLKDKRIDNNEDLDIEKIKTDREKIHTELDRTVKQFLEARYVINDQTKNRRYEQAKEVSTEKALDKYFEKALNLIDEDTELKEYSDLENYKSYASLNDINTSHTTVLAKGKQVLKADNDSPENITNFLFEISLVMENNKWKVDDITVKDITLYDD